MLRFSLILILSTLPWTLAAFVPAAASPVLAEDKPERDPPEEVVPPITPPTVVWDHAPPVHHFSTLRAQRKPA
jgi:hypothetical protein